MSLFFLLTGFGNLFAAPTFSVEELKLFDVIMGEPEEKLDAEEVRKRFTSPDFKERKTAFDNLKKLSSADLKKLNDALEKLGEVDPEFKARLALLRNFEERKAKLTNLRMLKGQVNISTGMATVGDRDSKFINDGDWATEANPKSPSFSYGVVFGTAGDKPEAYEVKHIVVNWGVYGGYYLKDKLRKQEYVRNYKIQYLGVKGNWKDLHVSNSSPSEEKNDGITMYSKKVTDYYTGTYVAHLELKEAVTAKGIRVEAKSGMHWIKLLELEVYGQKAR